MNIYYYDNNDNCSVSNLLNFRISLTMGVSIKTVQMGVSKVSFYLLI